MTAPGRRPVREDFHSGVQPRVPTSAMAEYCSGIWAARYFWMHLALADLRARFRKSFVGILWAILQPLFTAILLAVVLARLFQSDIRSYAPYIISGMIVWEFVMAVSTGGALSFVQADAYIKLFHHPLAIYSLRTVITNLAVLLLASLPMFVWAAVVKPERVGITWISAFTLYPILLLIFWPLITLLSYLASRFRDLPNVMALLMQVVWFISPVYFETAMFRRAKLDALVDYNPVYHLLQIVRAPLLEGKWPTAADYGFCGGMAVLFAALACLVGRKAERKVIFYL